MPEDINLYTHLRLDDFVNNFKQWFNCPTNPLNLDNNIIGDDYDYMSFIPSPDAVYLIDIGRIPLVDLPLFQKINTTTSTSNSATVNTPLGWKMQLGLQYADSKKTDLSKIGSDIYPIQSGLYAQVVKIPGIDVTSNIVQGNTPGNSPGNTPGSNNINLTFSQFKISQDNILKNVDVSGSSWIDSFTQPYESKTPNPYSKICKFIDYQKDFLSYSSPGSIPSSVNNMGISNGKNIDLNWLNTSFVGIEYFGYFKPDSVGNYSFNLDAGVDFCLMWLGNKAICEYVATNADIVSSNIPFSQTFLEDSYTPIRIQYFASKQKIDEITKNQNVRQFSVTVTNNDKNIIVDNSRCFYTINNYFPKFIYCAFTSSTVTDFQNGAFNCYSFGGSNDADYKTFFSYMKSNKRNIFTGVNDAVVSDGMSISEYGTLPNGINYTDNYNASTTVPSKLSIYRIYSDIRMGRKFQVNKKPVNGKYLLKEVSNNILSFTDKYTQFPNYYPANDIINGLPSIPETSESKCIDKCNADASNCSYFYTYGASGNQMCVLGTKYSSPYPTFNQIPGPNQTNGSLFLKGYKTAKPTIKECISGKLGNNFSFSSVTNTIDYTASNPYYNYTISGDIISNLNDIGDCRNSKLQKAFADYTDFKNEATNILSNVAEYRDDGEYDLTSSGKFMRPNYSSTLGKCNYAPSPENFQSEITDANIETGVNIKKLASIQQSVQQKEYKINKNKQNISDTLVPNFIETRNILKNDNKYDYNGDILLYLRDTKIPSKDEQRLIDSSDERFKQGSMYSLGIITAATLIILAIYLGRE